MKWALLVACAVWLLACDTPDIRKVDGMKCFDVTGKLVFIEPLAMDGVSHYDVWWYEENTDIDDTFTIHRGFGDASGYMYMADVGGLEDVGWGKWLCVRGRAVVMLETPR